MGTNGLKIELSKKAAKYFESVDVPTRKRLDRALLEIIEDPYSGPHIKRLKGPYRGSYRYDISWLRIIYSINENIMSIEVTKIGPRGDIYK